MRLKFIFLFTILFAAAGFLQAEVLLDSPKEIFIYNRQNQVWNFPAVKSGGTVTVEFRHRINCAKPLGWRPCWQIEVNGRLLTAMGSRTVSRLLNKPYYWKHKVHGPYPADNKSDKWYSLYQQDYHVTDNEFSPVHTEATRVVIDISDVVVLIFVLPSLSSLERLHSSVKYVSVPFCFTPTELFVDATPAPDVYVLNVK